MALSISGVKNKVGRQSLKHLEQLHCTINPFKRESNKMPKHTQTVVLVCSVIL